MLAVRRRPATLVVDALVDVRARLAGVDGVAVEGSGGVAVEGSGGEAFEDSGNGKGTGVRVFCSGDVMIAGTQMCSCYSNGKKRKEKSACAGRRSDMVYTGSLPYV